MSTREFNHDDNFNLLIQKAINNQDINKVTALIRGAIRRQNYIDLTEELSLAVALGNKHLIELIYPFYRGTPKLVPKIVLSKQGQKYHNCLLFLLDNGFTIRPKDPDMRAYMHSLIRYEHDTVFIKLMNHDINVNLVDHRTGYSLIHSACLANRMRIVKFLIKHRANVNAKVQKGDGTFPTAVSLMGKTALFIAVGTCNIPMTKFLLNHGADPNDNLDIFVSAIQNQRPEMIRILLEYGIDVNIANNHGQTLLHYCVADTKEKPSDSFRSKVAKILLDNGANVNAKTNGGTTALLAAIKYENVQVMRVFINYKANIFINDNGNNLLHIVMGAKNYEIFEVFWKRISSDVYKEFINVKNYLGQTPIHIGVKNGNIKGVQTLLNNNADVNLADNNGKTPLHIAIEAKNFDITKALLAKNAKIDARDNNGQTPLHHAANIDENGLMFIQYLMDYGAYVNSVDFYGRMPFHFTCRAKNTPVADYLLKNGAKINAKDHLKRNPLHWACYAEPDITKDAEFFELLVRNGVHINCTDFGGNSPLHYVVTRKSLIYTKLLLKAGVDINILNNKMETAVEYVSENMLTVFNIESDEDEIARHLREHIIKLKAAQLYVHEKNSDLAYKVNNSDARIWIEYYEACCRGEVSRMTQTRLNGSDITYHDVLMEKLDFTEDFTFNDDVMSGTKLNRIDANFPLYADILKLRFKEARIRRKLYLQVLEDGNYFSSYSEDIFYYFNVDRLNRLIEEVNEENMENLNKYNLQ